MSLENVKVSDRIYVPGRYGGVGELLNVERATPSQVFAGHRAFRKADGLQLGSKTSWGSIHARVPTDEDLLAVRLARASRAIRALQVTSENLEAVEALLKGRSNGTTLVHLFSSARPRARRASLHDAA